MISQEVVRPFSFQSRKENNIMENTTLYFREGNSDKVYQAGIAPKDDGFIVHFAYGRRGSTLNTGSKTQKPVDYPIARGIYDKLIREKMARGYTPGENGTPYQHTGKAQQASGIQCQLLNPVPEDQIAQLIDDRDHWMQEKMDGRRLLIKKAGGSVTGINRLGLTVDLPAPLIEEASACARDFLMDGEAIGDNLHAFDLLLVGDADIRGRRYGDRYLQLMNLLASFQHRHITLTCTLFTPADKQAHFSLLKKRNAEGVVFKHVDAPYTPGRPSTGGTQLKYKFHETASFIVASVNAKRSVSLILFEGEEVRPAGNVTIPPNYDVPAPGDIVEVRYLYAFQESGCIYQPVYQGPRDDIERSACTTDQLKFKPAPTAA